MERRRLQEILARSPTICVDMKSWLPTVWAKMLDSNSALEKIEPWGLLLGMMDLIGRVCLGGMRDILPGTCLHLKLCGFCASLLNDLKKLLYDRCAHNSSQYHPARKIFLFSVTAFLNAITTSSLWAEFNCSSCSSSFSVLCCFPHVQ